MPPCVPSRTRRSAGLAAVLMATVALAGCGGSKVEYQEVPGDPAEITLPEGSAAPADAAAEGEQPAEEGAAESATPAPEATPEATPQAGADTNAAGEETTADSGTDDVTAEDGPENDVPPAPGSDAQRFEDFCEQNAGAC